MFKIAISKLFLVVAVNLLLGSHLVTSANEVELDQVIYAQVLTKPSPQPDRVIEDKIFEDVVSNRVEKLKQFLDRGGDPNRYFYSAINAGSFDAVKMMIDRGAKVNLPGDDGVTPLMTAVRVTYRGGIEITRLLIKRGANINARASKGSTALMYASSGVSAHYEDEYVSVVQLLIKNGAKVNVRNNMGDSPLSIAKSGKWKKILAVLKSAGAKS